MKNGAREAKMIPLWSWITFSKIVSSTHSTRSCPRRLRPWGPCSCRKCLTAPSFPELRSLLPESWRSRSPAPGSSPKRLRTSSRRSPLTEHNGQEYGRLELGLALTQLRPDTNCEPSAEECWNVALSKCAFTMAQLTRDGKIRRVDCIPANSMSETFFSA